MEERAENPNESSSEHLLRIPSVALPRKRFNLDILRSEEHSMHRQACSSHHQFVLWICQTQPKHLKGHLVPASSNFAILAMFFQTTFSQSSTSTNINRFYKTTFLRQIITSIAYIPIPSLTLRSLSPNIIFTMEYK